MLNPAEACFVPYHSWPDSSGADTIKPVGYGLNAIPVNEVK
jgi:hypothetical protein